MKLTLDIPDEHAPRLLALLADLMPVRLEPQADPAEGHPELPLAMPVAEWSEKWLAESTHNGSSNLPHFKAYMAGAQAGKTGMALKQIARVMGDEISLDAQPDDESEEIAETRWAPIEGIDAADPLKVEMEATAPQRFENASTVTPVVGRRFYTRNGEVVKIVSRKSQPPYVTVFKSVNDAGLHYYYNNVGQNTASNLLDLVQQLPL